MILLPKFQSSHKIIHLFLFFSLSISHNKSPSAGKSFLKSCVKSINGPSAGLPVAASKISISLGFLVAGVEASSLPKSIKLSSSLGFSTNRFVDCLTDFGEEACAGIDGLWVIG